MIPWHIIKALEITDSDSRMRYLKQQTKENLIKTREELIDFKDKKRCFLYPDLIDSIDQILDETEPEEVMMQ